MNYKSWQVLDRMITYFQQQRKEKKKKDGNFQLTRTCIFEKFVVLNLEDVSLHPKFGILV